MAPIMTYMFLTDTHEARQSIVECTVLGFQKILYLQIFVSLCLCFVDNYNKVHFFIYR